MYLEDVVPTAFELTNKMTPAWDMHPGLVYYVHADVLPFHSQWYELLKALAEKQRFAGALTSSAVSHYLSKGISWRRAATAVLRDELYTRGYNYVGQIGGHGAVCWGHNVNTRADIPMPLYWALTTVVLVKHLDSWLTYMYGDQQPHDVVIRSVSYNYEGLIRDLAKERLLYLPTGIPPDSYVQLGDKLKITVWSNYPDRAAGTLIIEFKQRCANVRVDGALAILPELLETLYLPGTMTFENIEVIGPHPVQAGDLVGK